MSDVALWLGRIISVLPELIGLWKAARKTDSLEEQLALVLAMKRQQTKEEIASDA